MSFIEAWKMAKNQGVSAMIRLFRGRFLGLALLTITFFLGFSGSAGAQVKQESEPNNSSEQANEIRLGEAIEGTFQEDWDQDYYKLIVDRSGKNCLDIELTAVPGVNSRLQIADQDQHVLWDVDDGSEGEPESAKYFTVTEGIYYISVRGNHKNIENNYILSARLLGPWQQNQEAEPNEEPKWATEIKLNTQATGRINRNSDVDYFVLKVPQPGMDIIFVQLSGVPEVHYYLDIYDEKNSALENLSWEGTEKGPEIVKMKFKPGNYVLKLYFTPENNIGSEYTLYAGKPLKPPATPEEVRQALIQALGWLASRQAGDGSWPDYQEAYTGLSLMAFIGAKCVEKDYSANIKGAINYLKSKYSPSSEYPEGSEDAAHYGGQLGTDNMYEHAIATLALIEALVDLNEASLEPIAQDALNLIIRSQNTEHKPTTLGGPIKSDDSSYGGWRYRPSSTDSDISVTGWQILALKGAVIAGFSVPDYAFPAAAGFVRSLQGKEDGSFCYSSPGNSGYSCARAGMGALSLQLCGFPQDPAIAPALRFMQDYAPRWNVEAIGDGYAFYYWYYGTRAMYLSGGENWRIWKDWMCCFLVDHQNSDGSWDGTNNEASLDVYRVALGALMLEFCCGHVPIYMSTVKRLGPADIKVEFEKGAEKETTKNVELIMDASNSM